MKRHLLLVLVLITVLLVVAVPSAGATHSYKPANVTLKRGISAASDGRVNTNLQPGDLVFYQNTYRWGLNAEADSDGGDWSVYWYERHSRY